MARWQATVEAPLTYDYHGYTVVKCGPWSQGPVLLQQLALLQGFDLDAHGPDRRRSSSTPSTECAKLAFADREAWYGDPDFVDVPMATLLSRRLQRRARASWSASAPRSTAARARPAGCEPRADRRAMDIAAAAGSASRRADRCGGIGEPTAHANCGARRAATPAISTSSTAGATWSRRRRRGGWLQSSPVIPGARLLPRHARRRCSGSRRARRRAWRRGKRPRTTLTPSLALRDGEPYMAFGTPGGDQQDQWSTACLPAPCRITA